jgi:multisubunit Na+/H+ antiporter MnhG subunit
MRMYVEIFALVYGVVVIAYVALNIRKGAFVIDPSKLIPILIFVFAIAFAALVLVGEYPQAALEAVMKIGAAGILFAGTLPMLSAAVGLFRFSDEFGPDIFYARNHITGVIDVVGSLVMIFVGLLIVRIDLVAVGFFFFLLVPFVGNALANSYCFSYQRRLEK